MTPRELYAKNLPAIQAFAEGKPIDCRTRERSGLNAGPWQRWAHTGPFSPAFSSDDYEWRPTPAKTLRPWKLSEIPFPCRVKLKHQSGWFTILGAGFTEPDGRGHPCVCIIYGTQIKDVPLCDLLCGWEVLTADGTAPCGVEK